MELSSSFLLNHDHPELLCFAKRAKGSDSGLAASRSAASAGPNPSASCSPSSSRAASICFQEDVIAVAGPSSSLANQRALSCA